MDPSPTPSACPRCNVVGKSVKPITPKSLLTVDAQARATTLQGLQYCKTPSCDVAYYGPGGLFVKDDVVVRIGTKERESPRPVCYCTGRSYESIEAEIRGSGSSTAVAEITALCKNHKDRCPETNPQGSCCLGNVHAAIDEAKAKVAREQPDAPAPATTTDHDCCATDARLAGDPPVVAPSFAAKRGGVLLSGVAVAAAVLSSACCWLPLLLIALGASAGGVAGAFEEYRSALLAGTGALLAAGFYLVYFRKPKCEPGSACETPNPRLQRANNVMLWVATVVVAAFALFPNYVGAFFGGGDAAPAAVTVSSPVRTYRIDKMTCEGCVQHVRAAIAAAPGVDSVDVDFAARTARVSVRGTGVADGPIIVAVEQAGYKATRVDDVAARVFRVEGMTCEACVASIEEAVRRVSGVAGVQVSFADKTARVLSPADAPVSDAAVLAAIEAAGYRASPAE